MASRVSKYISRPRVAMLAFGLFELTQQFQLRQWRYIHRSVAGYLKQDRSCYSVTISDASRHLGFYQISQNAQRCTLGIFLPVILETM